MTDPMYTVREAGDGRLYIDPEEAHPSLLLSEKRSYLEDGALHNPSEEMDVELSFNPLFDDAEYCGLFSSRNVPEFRDPSVGDLLRIRRRRHRLSLDASDSRSDMFRIRGLPLHSLYRVVEVTLEEGGKRTLYYRGWFRKTPGFPVRLSTLRSVETLFFEEREAGDDETDASSGTEEMRFLAVVCGF